MTADITREEFERRIAPSVLENMAGHHLLPLNFAFEIANGDDLAELKAGLKKIEIYLGARINGVEGKVDGLTGRVDGLASKVDSLIRSLPKIVGDAVTDVLNGRHDKS